SALQSFSQMGLTALVVGLVVPWVAGSITALAVTMLILSGAALLLWWGMRLDPARGDREN
ncbi:MAG: hypothetical protein OEZ16_08170, partial [Chromatiales bacterium]|nr:hypothetical protein [Chromatiales bacterium]